MISTHLKHGFCKTLNVLGLAADGFEISMYFYIKVHFQKNFISENKVHCVLNRARTLTIVFEPVECDASYDKSRRIPRL